MNKPSIETTAANGNNSAKNNKQNRCKSFHFRYLELCRSKNVTPLPEIKSKNNTTTVLDVFGDKIGVTDWLLIVEALYSDQVLQTLGIRTRKSYGVVLDELDTEKKCKLFKQKPALYTKFVFSGIVEAISNSIQCNTNLKILNLEGLPLGENYIDTIAKAMASNESLKEVSFQRSNIYDKGCEAICNTMKYLENIEKINLSECGLTSKGAEAVADMIKMQKISRYTEGWQQSLRYREVDPNSIPGLRVILLSRNPQIDDDGVKSICEVLKEDVWIKVIELEACGLTDIGANLIIACLEVNNHITDFNVTGNKGINKVLQRQIQDQLGKEDEERKAFEEHQQLINGVTSASLANKKVSMSLLKEKLKSLEEQLNFERVLRKKAEQLNERLNQQIQAYESQLEESANDQIPEGYVVVKNESLQSIIKERKELLEHLAAINHEKEQAATTQNTARTFRHQIMEINEPPMDGISIVNLCDEFVEEQEIDEQTPQQQHSKFTKVRKVKSEIKYIEPPAKAASQKREPKSDHEFYSEAEFQQFSEVLYEGNIGDGLVNNVPMTQRSSPHTHRVEKKSVRYAASSGGGGAGNGGNCGGGDVADDYKQQQHHSGGNNNNSNGYMGNYGHHMYGVHGDGDIMTMANNFDMEELGLESTRSRRSEAGSTESDTIRCPLEQQQMKVFVKPKSAKKKAKAAREAAAAAAAAAAQQMYGESFDPTMIQKKDMMDAMKTSPRSLFWGLNEEE